MKRLWLMVGAVAFVLPLAAETETVDGYTWTYRIVGTGAEIVNQDSRGYVIGAAISPDPVGPVTVPLTLGGRPVSSLGDKAFYGCTKLTGVTILGGVTNIGAQAFGACDVLASVTFPSTVRAVGEACFSDCKVLPRIEIPAGVASIPASCFSGCTSLEAALLPESVTTIGSRAFYSCSSLRNITLPSGLRSIGEWAFAYAGLRAVIMPDSVIAVGQYAFYECGDLREVRLSKALTSIAESTFRESGLQSVVIPASVVSLGADSFYHWHGFLTNVVFCGSAPAGIEVSRILDHAEVVYYPLAWAASYAPYVGASLFAGYTDSLDLDDGLPKTYTVVFDANGGGGTMESQAFTVGTAQSLRVNRFSREGYDFVGWAKSANGSVAYSDGQSVKDLTTAGGGTVTLYAVWRVIGGGDPAPGTPGNDSFAAATVLEASVGAVGGTVAGATLEGQESQLLYLWLGNSVWYSWRAPCSGIATFDTLGTFAAYGRPINTVLGVYTGDAISELEYVAFNDDDLSSDHAESSVTFAAEEGTTYRILVGVNDGSDVGRFLLHWRVTQAAAPVPGQVPTVTNTVTVIATNLVEVTQTNTVTVPVEVAVPVSVTNTVTVPVSVTNMMTVTNIVRRTVTSVRTVTNVVDVAVTNLVDVTVTNTVLAQVAVTSVIERVVARTNVVAIAQEAGLVPEEVRDFKPRAAFSGEDKMKMNGLVFDADGAMQGIIQVETARETAKGVKVKGFVMLEDGKKIAMKAVTVPVDHGRLAVGTSVGKLGMLDITVGGDGFRGTMGGMTVVSAAIGEDMGVLKGSLTVKYLDAAGKVKSRKISLGGVVSDGTAAGTVTERRRGVKAFAAAFE